MHITTTLLIIVWGTGILGFVAGVFGSLAFLKKQSLLADAISHAALPGIATAFLLTHSKNSLILLMGGACTGILGAFLVFVVSGRTRLKNDAALGIVLSVFFGVGLVLLTVIQKLPIAQQTILNKFLFGNAATLLVYEVQYMTVIACAVLLILYIFWRPCVVIIFDPLFAVGAGISTYRYDILLLFLMVIVIMLGLQTVGVVLMSALFVAPAVAARQWTNTIHAMVFCAGFLGLLSCVVGTLISNFYDNMPTGPTIVVVMSMVVFVSLIVGNRKQIKRLVGY